MDKNMDVRKFLHLMSLIESSGGKNTKHKQIRKGIHAGDRAVGHYGLMPNTMEELDRRAAREGQDIASDQHEYAAQMHKLLMSKPGIDDEKAAYMWQYGHNKDPRKIPQDVLDKNERIRKYRELKRMLGFSKPKANPIVLGLDETPLDILQDEYNA